jgi:tetraacyldisaccharide 4'-kinase
MTPSDRLVATWYAGRPGLVALALGPVSLLFGGAVALRRALYRAGIFRSVRLPVPVVVVGNITVGGSGKTPLVAALVRALSRRGFHPGVVSRGHGRDDVGGPPLVVAPDDDPARVGDEPLLLARTGCPVVVGRDRVAAGRELIARHPACDVILSDDGLQHYRLFRNVEIAVVDSARGSGNGMLLPAGPLREPAGRLDEVDAVVVLAPEPRERPGSFPRTFAMTFECRDFIRVADPRLRASPTAFVGSDVHAVAGIGHPDRFFATLASLGIRATPHAFADHHRFAPPDLAFPGARAILMTEKDAVKCAAFADERCWYLPVEARVDDGLVALIEERIRGSQAA